MSLPLTIGTHRTDARSWHRGKPTSAGPVASPLASDRPIRDCALELFSKDVRLACGCRAGQVTGRWV